MGDGCWHAQLAWLLVEPLLPSVVVWPLNLNDAVQMNDYVQRLHKPGTRTQAHGRRPDSVRAGKRAGTSREQVWMGELNLRLAVLQHHKNTTPPGLASTTFPPLSLQMGWSSKPNSNCNDCVAVAFRTKKLTHPPNPKSVSERGE